MIPLSSALQQSHERRRLSDDTPEESRIKVLVSPILLHLAHEPGPEHLKRENGSNVRGNPRVSGRNGCRDYTWSTGQQCTNHIGSL